MKNFLQNSLSQTQSIYDLFNKRLSQNFNENEILNFGEMFGLEREKETKRKMSLSKIKGNHSKININHNQNIEEQKIKNDIGNHIARRNA